MDIERYRHYLGQFVNEAIANSNGTNAGIAECLQEKQIGRFFVRHRNEKERALHDARKAFDEHRHWPLDIVLSHLGIASQE